MDRIRLGGLQYQELKLLIDFMYKAELEVTVDSAPAIMAAADLLLMEKVKAAVCEFLQKLICPANCVYLNRLAEASAIRRRGAGTGSPPGSSRRRSDRRHRPSPCRGGRG